MRDNIQKHYLQDEIENQHIKGCSGWSRILLLKVSQTVVQITGREGEQKVKTPLLYKKVIAVNF